jgi:hypothetical protein
VFDALDNLFEPTPPVEEQPAAQTPEPPREEEVAAAAESVKRHESLIEAPSTEPLSTANTAVTTTVEEKPFTIGAEAQATTPQIGEDTLGAFIEELEESTAGSNEPPLPLVRPSTPTAIAAPDLPEETAETTNGASPPSPDILTTALESIDDTLTATEELQPPVEDVERDDSSAESVDEIFSIEPVAFEPEEPDDASVETLEEFLTVESLDAEPDERDNASVEAFEEIFNTEPVTAEPEEPDDASVETLEEFLTVEALDAEPDERDNASVEAFEEIFNTEPVTAELEEPDDASVETLEEFLTVESLDAEPDERDNASVEAFEEIFNTEPVTAEPEEPDDASVETSEEFLTVEALDAESDERDNTSFEAFEEIFTEPEEPDDATAETFEEFLTIEATAPEQEEPDDAAVETFEEPIASDDDLDAFFEEVDTESGIMATETSFDSVAIIEPESEAPLGNSDLDAFFDEPATEPRSETPEAAMEQDELLDIFEDEANDELQSESDEESTMDAMTLPEEPAETPEQVEPAPRPDPLEPFSEEQLESMLSPSEEQAAEEAAARKVSLYAPEELDLDTGDTTTEELTVNEEPQPPAEPPTLLTDYTVPTDYVILAELATTKSGSGAATILWALGIVLMCGTLVLQYLYYHRLQLVENPQLRPVLTTLCELTGCELPPRRDLGRIELTEHLMQFHPNYEQSLLISATLANRADFDQPYPLVEIVMTDIEQRVVAQRRFPPEQYLHNYHSGNSFRANSEVPLQLEVLDPGNDAVGFEFRFY